MKKIFTLLVALLVGGAVASAEVKIGETTYDDLAAAVANATEGATITINGEIQIANTIDLSNVPNITISAEEENATIKCLVKNKLAFLTHNTATLKNLTLTYIENDASSSPLIESSNSTGNLTIDNCTICNFNGTNNQGVISVKGSGKVKLNNVTFTNNTVKEGRGEVFIGNSGSTIDGTTNCSLYIENQSIAAGSNFDPAEQLILYVQKQNDNANIITGTDKAYLFALQNAGKILVANGSNLKLANEGTKVIIEGKKGYDTLTDAVNASIEGDVLNVNEDDEVKSRLNILRSVTIQGSENTHPVISSSMDDNIAVLVKAPATIKNVDFQYTKDTNSSKVFIESSNAGNLTLENSVISNFKTKENKGVVNAMTNGKVQLTNVTFENCVVPENRGEIFFGASGSTINGTTNGSIYVERTYTFNSDSSFNPAPKAASETNSMEMAPAANAVKLYLQNHGEGNTVVIGNPSPTMFNFSHETLELAEKDGNLVLQKKTGTGIVGIEADGNAPVEYYNLNGVQVKADNMTLGVYVRRQGKNVTKVMVK